VRWLTAATVASDQLKVTATGFDLHLTLVVIYDNIRVADG